MTHSIYGGDLEGYWRGITEQAKVARKALIADARAFWLSPDVPADLYKQEYSEEVAQIHAMGHIAQIKKAKAEGLI